jgi:hypothetical protein
VRVPTSGRAPDGPGPCILARRAPRRSSRSPVTATAANAGKVDRAADPPPHRRERRGRGLSSSPETSTASICPYRALPGYMIDLIRDGLSRSKLRAGGDRAVFNALVRTAGSARQRGHTYPQWAELISQVRSALGRQARQTSRGKERSRAAYERMLQRAWDKAEAWLTTAPPPLTRADIAAQIAAVDAGPPIPTHRSPPTNEPC